MFLLLILQFFSTVIGQAFAATGNYSQCLPLSFYENLGIDPGDRSGLAEVKFLKAGWDSAVILNDILSILLREAMGFNGKWVYVNGATATYEALVALELDLATEIWAMPPVEHRLKVLSVRNNP